MLAERSRGPAGACFLSTRCMLSWAGVAVTLLTSPTQASVSSEVPQEILSSDLAPVGRTESRPVGNRGAEPGPATEVQAWSWLAQLAVLRPESRLRRAPSTVQMFIVVAPVGKAVGIRAIGSF